MGNLYGPPPDPPYGRADYGLGSDHPVQADIPARPRPPAQRTGGLAAGGLAILGVLLKFKGLSVTLISTAVTALLYAHLFGWAFGVGIVALILVHESGHVVVARMIGVPTSLPIVIPFLGALVNVKQPPRSVAQESQMAIGGPIIGSLGAALCYVGYQLAPTASYAGLLLALAYFGFLINLFNLVPVTPLDGGRVLSLLSKWFNVAGLAIAVAILLFSNFRSPVLVLVVIFGAFGTFQRFRSTGLNPAYYQVPASTKWLIGSLYLVLLVGLALGMEFTRPLLQGV